MMGAYMLVMVYGTASNFEISSLLDTLMNDLVRNGNVITKMAEMCCTNILLKERKG